MQQWEYQILDSPDVSALNGAGRDGWEVVAAVPYATHIQALSGPTALQSWHQYVYLKRPRSA